MADIETNEEVRPVYSDDPFVTAKTRPPEDVAEILKAYNYGDHVVCLIREKGHTDLVWYTLMSIDEHGIAPGLHAQLQRMLDAGEIKLEPPPAEPVNNNAGIGVAT